MYLKFDTFIKMSGYTRREVDHGCYLKKFDSSYIIFEYNVDDVFIVGSDMQMINELRIQLTKKFKAMNQGVAKPEKKRKNGTLHENEIIKKRRKN